MYVINDYQKQQAKKLNVIIKPSTRKGKKIDVYNLKGDFICSIGALGYLDYPTIYKKYGEQEAKKRQKLYRLRHAKDRKVKGSAGYYADKILW